jgi:hypothetical protein
MELCEEFGLQFAVQAFVVEGPCVVEFEMSKLIFGDKKRAV